jgi:hypothetical protein
MQEELKRSTQKVLSAEERAQEIDSRLTEEDEHLQQLEKDIAKMREKQVSFAFLYTVQLKSTIKTVLSTEVSLFQRYCTRTQGSHYKRVSAVFVYSSRQPRRCLS